MSKINFQKPKGLTSEQLDGMQNEMTALAARAGYDLDTYVPPEPRSAEQPLFGHDPNRSLEGLSIRAQRDLIDAAFTNLGRVLSFQEDGSVDIDIESLEFEDFKNIEIVLHVGKTRSGEIKKTMKARVVGKMRALTALSKPLTDKSTGKPRKSVNGVTSVTSKGGRHGL